jgi:hypothetical protein
MSGRYLLVIAPVTGRREIATVMEMTRRRTVKAMEEMTRRRAIKVMEEMTSRMTVKAMEEMTSRMTVKAMAETTRRAIKVMEEMTRRRTVKAMAETTKRRATKSMAMTGRKRIIMAGSKAIRYLPMRKSRTKANAMSDPRGPTKMTAASSGSVLLAAFLSASPAGLGLRIAQNLRFVIMSGRFGPAGGIIITITVNLPLTTITRNGRSMVKMAMRKVTKSRSTMNRLVATTTSGLSMALLLNIRPLSFSGNQDGALEVPCDSLYLGGFFRFSIFIICNTVETRSGLSYWPSSY